MHMAVELAIGLGGGFGRFGGNFGFLSSSAFSVAAPFLTVVLEGLVLGLEDRVSALQFRH